MRSIELTARPSTIRGCLTVVLALAMGCGGRWDGAASKGNAGSETRPSGAGGANMGGANASGGRESATGGAAGSLGGTDAACKEAFLAAQSCGSVQVEAPTYTLAARPANVLIALDKSSSMQDVPSTFVGDKWTAVKLGLAQAMTDASSTGEIRFGLLLFPGEEVTAACSSAAECCALSAASADVTVPVEADAAPSIMQALDATSPGGETPTVDALAQALDYYTIGAGAALDGSKYVLLVTDGVPDCNDANSCSTPETCAAYLDERCPASSGDCCPNGAGYLCLDDARTAARLQQLEASGIRTLILTVPWVGDRIGPLGLGDELRQSIRGCVDCSDPGAKSLEGDALFEHRVSQVIGLLSLPACRIDLGHAYGPEFSLWGTAVGVALDCALAASTEPNGSGWTYTTDRSGAAIDGITFWGDTCDEIIQGGLGRLDLVWACPVLH